MQSYWMQMTESATALELRETPVPDPGPRQLLVRMHAAALNRGEFLLGHGLHGKPGTWKAIGGEGAGEVVVAGAEVSGFRPGDRVMGRCAGAFSEYVVMEAAELRPCRPLMGRACELLRPLVPTTCWSCGAKPGEWLLRQRSLVRRRRASLC